MWCNVILEKFDTSVPVDFLVEDAKLEKVTPTFRTVRFKTLQHYS